MTFEDWLNTRGDLGRNLVAVVGSDVDTNAAALILGDGERMTFWRVSGNSVELITDQDGASMIRKLDAAQRKNSG